MASARYTLNIDPEDLKPYQPPELTPKQKRANWLDYHWKHIIASIVAVVVAAWFLHDYLSQVHPDYQVGIVSRMPISEDACNALGNELAAYGEDLNGDGQVLVDVLHYAVDLRTTDEMTAEEQQSIDPMIQAAGQTRLVGDVQMGETLVYLTDNAEGLHRISGLLSDENGELVPEDADISQALLYSWKDCPNLESLELGQVEDPLTHEPIEVKPLLENLTVLRRGYMEGKGPKNPEKTQEFFQKIVEGATAQ